MTLKDKLKQLEELDIRIQDLCYESKVDVDYKLVSDGKEFGDDGVVYRYVINFPDVDDYLVVNVPWDSWEGTYWQEAEYFSGVKIRKVVYEYKLGKIL